MILPLESSNTLLGLTLFSKKGTRSLPDLTYHLNSNSVPDEQGEDSIFDLAALYFKRRESVSGKIDQPGVGIVEYSLQHPITPSVRTFVA